MPSLSCILPCGDFRIMTYFASLFTKLSIPELLSITTVLMLPPSGLAQETTDQPSQSPNFVPTGVPSFTTIAPLAFQPAVLACQDTPNWRFYDFGFDSKVRFCDDDEVYCTYTFGSVTQDVYALDAPASKHCCKCKEGCDGLCGGVPPTTSPPSPETVFDCQDPPRYLFCNNNENKEKEGPSAVSYIVIGAVAVLCCIGFARVKQGSMQRQRALSSTRQTMSDRRQQRFQFQLASSPTKPTTPARDEQILIKFYFQRVLPDKSRTALETRAALQSGGQETAPPESSVRPDNSTTALEQTPQNEDEENLAGSRHKTQGESPSSRGVLSVLSQRLSSWRKASPSDECCICLDGYHPGETICAPITDKCNHFFHEQCVVEWLRDHDVCPLCRVNLME
eukprot:scaffold3107_cov126-Cylindrotheca_fusiformis.AAC.4